MPLSVACTVRLKVGVDLEVHAPRLVFTVIWPELLIAKALPVLPAVIAKVCVWPASGSFAATVPTTVPFALFSASENGPPESAPAPR